MAFTFTSTVLVMAFANLVTGSPSSQDAVMSSVTNTTGDAGILRSLIAVYAFPLPGTSIYVKLYSRDDSRAQTFTELGQLEYAFTAGAATKFWVDAIKVEGTTLQRITSKPVLGDGVPSKSGTWWVTPGGMYRSNEDSSECTPASNPCSRYESSWRNV